VLSAAPPEAMPATTPPKKKAVAPVLIND